MSQNKTFLKILIFTFMFFSVEIAAAYSQCSDLFESSEKVSLFSQLRSRSANIFSRFNSAERTGRSPYSEEEKSAWDVLVSKDTKFKKLDYVVARRDAKNPLVWWMWEELPEASRKVIFDLLSEFKGADKEISEFLAQRLQGVSEDPMNPKLFFSFIVTSWLSDRQLNNVSFSDWILANVNAYHKRVSAEAGLAQSLKQKYEWAILAMKSRDAWSQSDGVHELEITNTEGIPQAKILGHNFQAKVDSGHRTVQIFVPRSQVKVAAWNPIYTEVLAKKISGGRAPLQKYQGFLAADGYFYLSDGNHRFTIDQRPEIWIEMSFPAKTSSLSITFDAMGVRQPSIEQLIEFHEGDLTLEDLMPNRSQEILFK